MRDSQVKTFSAEWSGFSTGAIFHGKPKVSSSLSEILQKSEIPSRFFLSPKACAGILRRAAKRGKALPEALDRALRAVAESTPTE